MKNTVNKLDIIETCRIMQLKTAECTFFSRAHRIFTKIGKIFGHKTNLSEFYWIVIMQNIFSDNSEIKQEINNEKINSQMLMS